MVIMLKIVLLMSCLALACQAEVAFPGPCPIVFPMLNFDSVRLFGKWYEMAKYYSTNHARGKCASTTFTPSNPGPTSIKYQDVDIYTNTPSTILGTATQEGQRSEARFSVAYPGILNPSTYIVLDTNYLSYAIFYSCANFYFFHHKYVWILSPSLEFYYNYASYPLEVFGIPRAYLTTSDQLNCPAIR